MLEWVIVIATMSYTNGIATWRHDQVTPVATELVCLKGAKRIDSIKYQYSSEGAHTTRKIGYCWKRYDYEFMKGYEKRCDGDGRWE